MNLGQLKVMLAALGFKPGGGGSQPVNTSSILYYQGAVGYPVSNTVTTAQTATSITIPANAANANARIEILVEYTISGTATTKTLDITDSGTGFVIATNGGTFAGSGYFGSLVIVSNRNSQTSQFIRNKAITTPFTTGSANGATQNPGALDFTVARTLNFNITFSATGGTETVRVESFQVRIWNP